MYRIPSDFNVSKAIGQCATQIRVGEFDIQFEIGEVHFAIWGPITLIKNGKIVGTWEVGKWPTPQFLKILNVDLASYDIPDNRRIILCFKNGVEMHLQDHSDQFESMQIGPWII